jgi:hypothetical protein
MITQAGGRFLPLPIGKRTGQGVPPTPGVFCARGRNHLKARELCVLSESKSMQGARNLLKLQTAPAEARATTAGMRVRAVPRGCEIGASPRSEMDAAVISVFAVFLSTIQLL